MWILFRFEWSGLRLFVSLSGFLFLVVLIVLLSVVLIGVSW